MSLNFTGILSNLKPLLWGTSMTLIVSSSAIAIGVLGGLALCFAIVSKSPVARALGGAYISSFRGTPMLVQLLLAYYLLPPVLHINVPPLVAAIGAISMNTSAFQAEIYRGGLMAIAPGQLEAARILGISRLQAQRVILIPQMMRLVLPSLTNEAISILKASSLVSVIAVTDLMRVSEDIVAVDFRTTETYVSVALIYLLLNTIIARLGRILEIRLGHYA
jgi:polar amino acid transport system permease protein